MKLLGKRLLLNIPQIPESVIELSEETQKQLERDMISKWTALEVFAVGQDVTLIKSNDRVYISSISLRDAERIIVDGETKMMVFESDVAIIWSKNQNLNYEKRSEARKFSDTRGEKKVD